MGIRQTLNENPVYTAGATGAVIVLALIFILFQLFGHRHRAGGHASGKFFFSDDDGKSWFIDDASKLPPFDHNGKPAVRAFVFRCADGTQFVGRLERLSDEGKAKMEQKIKDNPALASKAVYIAPMGAIELKLPGQENWMPVAGTPSADIRKAMQPVCPKDGSRTGVVQVLPE